MKVLSCSSVKITNRGLRGWNIFSGCGLNVINICCKEGSAQCSTLQRLETIQRLQDSVSVCVTSFISSSWVLACRRGLDKNAQPPFGELHIWQRDQMNTLVSGLHKMYLITLILGIVLLPKVTSLKCHQCVGQNGCTGTEMVCSPGQSRCGAMSIKAYAGGQKQTDVQVKSCAAPQECIKGSINFGISKTEMTSRCCSSDLCNSQPAPEPERKSPNGNKCFYCDGNTCDASLNCEGDEDHCITATVPAGDTKVQLKGCASKFFCTSVDNPQVKQILGDVFSCCQGSFCNSAIKTSAGLLMLPVLLISLVVFS